MVQIFGNFSHDLVFQLGRVLVGRSADDLDELASHDVELLIDEVPGFPFGGF